MGFVIGLLTLILVLNCFVLTLLVLVQLPKKEAGAGLAFGGAATETLFGAGSGTVLTKITKYAATGFFVLAFVLAVLQSRFQARRSSDFERLLAEPPAAGAPVIPGAGTAAPAPAPASPTVPLTTDPAALPAPQENAVPQGEPATTEPQGTTAPAEAAPTPGTTGGQ